RGVLEPEPDRLRALAEPAPRLRARSPPLSRHPPRAPRAAHRPAGAPSQVARLSPRPDPPRGRIRGHEGARVAAARQGLIAAAPRKRLRLGEPTQRKLTTSSAPADNRTGAAGSGVNVNVESNSPLLIASKSRSPL